MKGDGRGAVDVLRALFVLLDIADVDVRAGGEKGFTVDPLFLPTWDYLVLENLRYRGHDVDVRWCRATKRFTISVDGKVVVTRERPSRCEVAVESR